MSTDFVFAPYNFSRSWADEDEAETQKQFENMTEEEKAFLDKDNNTYTSKMEVVVDKKKQRKEKKKSRSPKKN